ncbi:EamA family transporter [Bacillus mycoides]|nr:EamA family transporter [Bacillus mycoides]
MIHSHIEVTLSIIYLGVFPTVLPYITSHAGASEATSSLYLTPVTACFIAWIWVPTFVSIVGGVITILGVIITHLTFKKDNYKQIESGKYL